MVCFKAILFQGVPDLLEQFVTRLVSEIVIDPFQSIGVNGYLVGFLGGFLIGPLVAKTGQVIREKFPFHFFGRHFGYGFPAACVLTTVWFSPRFFLNPDIRVIL